MNEDIIKQIALELNIRIEQVKSTNLKAIKYGFISRSGYDLKNKYPYELLKLEDLYY